MTREELEKLADRYQRKADRAFESFQETGIRRYDTERNNAEDLADALRMAANAADEHHNYIHMRCMVAGYVALAKEINMSGTKATDREKMVKELTENLIAYGNMMKLG